MPDAVNSASFEQPEAIPFRIDNPEQIPAPRYYDEAFYKLERQLLWSRTWQMACRIQEIPDVGDWVEYRIFDKSVIIVRAESGIKAFHNACRHRGMRVARGRGHCSKNGFVCSFHGWQYNIEGKNTFVYGAEKFSANSLKAAELNLRPCRVETWGGCAFINFDKDATPFIDHIGPTAARLALAISTR